MRGWVLFVALACVQTANAQDATFAVRQLTPETALRAAQAALETWQEEWLPGRGCCRRP